MSPENWLRFVYGQGYDQPSPERAAQLLDESPDLAKHDAWLACAAGDEAAVQKLAEHPNQIGGPLEMPPLFAVAFSSLLRVQRFAGRIRRAAELLIDAGADVNARWSSPAFPGSSLSALYAAAGANHDVDLARLLLAHGADPNDNESLYHSLEGPGLACTRLLLEGGAKPTGTNALCRVLDFDNFAGLQLLLQYGADPNERQPVIHAIKRRRSLRHFTELLKAGADPGNGAYRIAMLYGLPDVAALLTPEQLPETDLFVAACARGDRAEAARMRSSGASPDREHLHMLPNLTQAGCADAARLMVEMGWPVDVRGGDWNASALNLAVFRGDANLVRFLMAHGADWRVPHGYNDNVMGTLSYVSRNPGAGDWVACAQALIEGGMPVPRSDYTFSPEVNAYFKSVA